MDIHHDTSLRSIFEDDSISPTPKARIRFCLGKGAGLWLVVRLYIRSFHITPHFHLNIAFSSWFDSTLGI